MQIVQASRASAILYNLLINREDKRPWLLPANICPIVPITFLKAQTPFEFVDISALTLHMDLDQAERRIRAHTFGGLLYAHTYGESSTPNDFFVELKRLDQSILLVDDRCLCIPELKPVSTNAADVQLYSTGYAKVVDLGSGGYAFLRKDLIYNPVHLPFDPRDHNQIEKDYKRAVQNRVPFEYKDSDWLETDANLPSWNDYCQQIEGELKFSLAQRARLNAVYASHLPAEIQLREEYQQWRFNIRVPHKAKVMSAIFAAGLFASSHYASLAGIMADGQCPQAEILASEIINLFNDRHFDKEKAEQVCRIILENLSQAI